MATRIVERKRLDERLTLTLSVREWFERYELFVFGNNLLTVPAETATNEQKNRSSEKEHCVFHK